MPLVSAQVTEFSPNFGSQWNNAGNWSGGVPDTSKEFRIGGVIPFLPVGYTAVIDNHSAQAGGGFIAVEPGKPGRLIVQNGGTLDLGLFVVGFNDTGALNVLAGGRVTTTAFLYAGFGQNGAGSILVSGANSTLQAHSIFLSGVGGATTMVIEDGAVVNTGSGFSAVELGDVAYGNTTAHLTISGTPGARGVLATPVIARNVDLSLESTTATVTFDGGVFRGVANRDEILARFSPGTVTLAAGGGFFDSNGFTIKTAHGLTGAGGLTKQGSGTLELLGANTYLGGTTAEGGTLVLKGSISHTDASIQARNGGSLQITAGGQASATAADVRSSGSITVGGVGARMNLTGEIAVGSFGDGELRVTEGGLVTAGLVRVGGNGGDGVVSLAAANGQSGILQATGFQWTQGSAQVNFTGGTFRAAGDNPEIFSTQTPASVLASVSLGSGGGIIHTDGHNVGTAFDISGSGGLVKQGAGELRLNSSNSYSGGTEVLAGALVVNNLYGGATGSGDTVIRSGALLTGSGGLDGRTTVHGTVAPGLIVGLLEFRDSSPGAGLVLASTSTLSVEIASLTSFDQLQVNGDLVYDGLLQVAFLNGFLPEINDTMNLVDVFGSSSGVFAGIEFVQRGYAGNYDHGSGVLTITAVPEPSAAALLALGMLGVLVVRRRPLTPKHCSTTHPPSGNTGSV